jgi:hypothetical protein
MQADRAIPAALLPWMLAGALLCLAALVLGWNAARAVPPPPAGFVDFNLERLRNLQQQLSGAERVVVLLGDSRLKYVVPDEADFARALAEQTGHPTRVVRVVNNLAVFADFAPLLAEIDALDPDLIVVQRDLLHKDRPVLHAVELRRAQLLHRLTSRAGSQVQREQQELQFGLPCWQRENSRRQVAVGPQALQAKLDAVRQVIELRPDGGSPLQARRFVADRARLGMRVAILELQSAPRYESFLRERNAQPAELPALGVQRWIAPSQPDEHFCDLTHLSRDGGREVGGWLLASAAAALRTRATSHNESAAMAAVPGIL